MNAATFVRCARGQASGGRQWTEPAAWFAKTAADYEEKPLREPNYERLRLLDLVQIALDYEIELNRIAVELPSRRYAPAPALVRPTYDDADDGNTRARTPVNGSTQYVPPNFIVPPPVTCIGPYSFRRCF